MLRKVREREIMVLFVWRGARQGTREEEWVRIGAVWELALLAVWV
jgi:hypothetical protein